MIPPLVHTFHLDEGAVFRWRFAGLILGGLLLVAYWQEWIVSPFPWDLGLILTFLYGYSTFHRAFQDVISRRISADQAVTLAALGRPLRGRVSGRRRGGLHHARGARRWRPTPPKGSTPI